MEITETAPGRITKHIEEFKFYKGNERSEDEGIPYTIEYNAYQPDLLFSHPKANAQVFMRLCDFNLSVNCLTTDQFQTFLRSAIGQLGNVEQTTLVRSNIKWLLILEKCTRLSKINCSDKTIQEIHSLILANQNPYAIGQFRQKQVWISKKYAWNPTQADFVPPHPDHVPKLMDNWISKFNENCDAMLVQAAILFYQFLTIHPFENGNGRAARALLSLFFFSRNVFFKELLFLTRALKHDLKQFEFDLTKARFEGIWDPYLSYFYKSMHWLQEGSKLESEIQAINLMS